MLRSRAQALDSHPSASAASSSVDPTLPLPLTRARSAFDAAEVQHQPSCEPCGGPGALAAPARRIQSVSFLPAASSLSLSMVPDMACGVGKGKAAGDAGAVDGPSSPASGAGLALGDDAALAPPPEGLMQRPAGGAYALPPSNLACGAALGSPSKRKLAPQDSVAPGGGSVPVEMAATGPPSDGNASNDPETRIAAEQAASMLDELSTTRPAFIISVVAKHPVALLLLLFLIMVAAMAPVAFEQYRPKLNNDFAALQIRSHASSARVQASTALKDNYADFWRPVERVLAQAPAARRLQQATAAASPPRTHITLQLHIFYRYADNSSTINPALVQKAREVEQRIAELPRYEEVCLQQQDGSCHMPLGFPSILYAQPRLLPGSFGAFAYDIAPEVQREIAATATRLVANNVSYFFGIASNGTESWLLHTIVLLSEPLGTRHIYEGWWPELVDIFETAAKEGDGSGHDLIINYGEQSFINWQVTEQLFEDALWAALSVMLAAAMLWIGTGSLFLMFTSIFQLVAAFPIGWLIYSTPLDWAYFNFIHFLAPFVILGIGLDDIFVVTSFYKDTLRYSDHYAIDTRMTLALKRAGGATFATSATSAFAFAANVFSPVPAVQSFGLFLAILVLVSYLLTMLWLPVCLVVWDKHLYMPFCGGPASGVAPRALEYGRLAWPLVAPPRAADPGDTRLAVAEHLATGKPSRGGARGGVAERVFGRIFDVVWRVRWLTIGVVVAIAIVGAVGVSRLQAPPTSEPPLFEPDHNVQFFYRYMNSEEAANAPDVNSDASPLKALADPRLFLSAALSPAGVVLASGERRVNTLEVDVVWGVAVGGIDDSANTVGDPVGALAPARLTLDPAFNLSAPAQQAAVDAQLADLLRERAPGERLAEQVRRNPLDGVRDFCAATPDGGCGGAPAADCFHAGCAVLDPATGLPAGAAFDEAVYGMLRSNVTYREWIGYDYDPASLRVRNYEAWDPLYVAQNGSALPRVAWLRVEVASATAKGASPGATYASYRRWNDWAVAVQQGAPYRGMFAASYLWVNAVTYEQISNSVYGTVALSVALSALVVYVFTGRLRLTLLAAATVIMSNLTVMGYMEARGWYLGAIEAMSITSLVGLSVDFCIHLAEGVIHARSLGRWNRTREAVMFVGFPILASAVSTVAATAPLFATETLILNRFASIIALTMASGATYTLLFLAPTIAMFGPNSARYRGPARVAPEAGFWPRLVRHAKQSKAVRFAGACCVLLILFLVWPATRRSVFEKGPVARYSTLLVVLVCAALAVALARVCFKAALDKRRARRRAAAEVALGDVPPMPPIASPDALVV